MTDLEENQRIDRIAKAFFASWKAWRVSHGWQFGPDIPMKKLSPLVVDSFESLTPDGQLYFRQMTALFMHATKTSGADVVTARTKIRSALRALKRGDIGRAQKKVHYALRALREPQAKE